MHQAERVDDGGGVHVSKDGGRRFVPGGERGRTPLAAVAAACGGSSTTTGTSTSATTTGTGSHSPSITTCFTPSTSCTGSPLSEASSSRRLRFPPSTHTFCLRATGTLVRSPAENNTRLAHRLP